MRTTLFILIFLATSAFATVSMAATTKIAKNAEHCIKIQEEYFQKWADSGQFTLVKKQLNEAGRDIHFVTTDYAPRNPHDTTWTPNPSRVSNFNPDEKIKLIKKDAMFTPVIATGPRPALYDFLMIRPDFDFTTKKCMLVDQNDLSDFAHALQTEKPATIDEGRR